MTTTKQQAPGAAAPATPTQALTVPFGSAGGALGAPAGVLEELAKAARDAAALERPTVGKFSLKGGMMSYGGNAVPGNEMDAIILVGVHRRTMYEGAYNANIITNPACFALSLDGKDMVPHENVDEPQNATCKGCQWDEWGSAGNGSRGKKCKESRRLILMPSKALEGGVDAVKSAELAIMDVPVTSVKNYGNFVNILAASANIPMWAAVTKLKLLPHPKTQIELTFQPMQAIVDGDVLNAIKGRMEMATKLALVPFDETSGSDSEPQGADAPPAKPSKKF